MTTMVLPLRAQPADEEALLARLRTLVAACDPVPAAALAAALTAFGRPA